MGTISVRFPSATLSTYQPLRLVASSLELSRLNETGVKDSSGSFFSSVGLSAVSLAAGSGLGFGVRLRAADPSTPWTNSSPRFAYANQRPSSDHRSVSPLRSLAGTSTLVSPDFMSTYFRLLSVPPIVS